jgi:hypothetical protein
MTGMLVGVVLAATPAGAHVGGSVKHLWGHLRPKADKRYLPGNNLPAGKTIRGSYMLGYSATAGSQFAEDGYTFQQQLPAGPTPHYIPMGTTPPPACPGTEDFPKAAPGHLCVYENARANVTTGGFTISSPTLNTAGTAGRWGFYIQIRSDAAGLFYSNGTWAATARN